jgi:hypothetical protein
MRVFAWDANPSVDRFAFKQSEVRAAKLVQSGRGCFVTPPDGFRSVPLFPPVEVRLERAARNTVRPIARIINKLQRPPRIHYPVPAAGDHRKRWYLSFLSGTGVAPGDQK